MKDELYKKFTEISTRPGRGGIYPYIKWQDVADRMNQIFGIKWSSEIVYQDVVNSNVVTRIRVGIFDVETGVVFYQEGFGGASMDDKQEAGNPFKAAYSKALKDACKKWGIGLYLDDDEEPKLAESIKPFVVVPPEPVVPGNAVNTNIQTSFIPPMIDAVVGNTTTVKQHETPSIPPLPTLPKNETVVGDMTTVKQYETPPIPPLSNVETIVSNKTIDSQNTISDVQKVALQSILSIQGVKYEELVKEAFALNGITVSDNIPAIDALSYKEAVMVVKYGNDTFRKR